MTDRGLKLIAEMQFDSDQLKVHCESEEEREIVEHINQAIQYLDDEQDYYYNRRKEEVMIKS